MTNYPSKGQKYFVVGSRMIKTTLIKMWNENLCQGLFEAVIDSSNLTYKGELDFYLCRIIKYNLIAITARENPVGDLLFM